MSTGISKNELKRVRSLHQKKFRKSERLFIAEGFKVVGEALRSSFEVTDVFTTDESFAQVHSQARLISSNEMNQISCLSTPPGYLAVIRQKEMALSAPLPEKILVFDGLRDPGNVGTLIRTADWFGLTTILASDDSVEWYNPKTVQASMGSVFRMNLIATDILSTCIELQQRGYTVVTTEMNGQPVDSFTWPDLTILVMGSESHGVSSELSALAAHRITIPGAGWADSLNVTVAGGIILSRLFPAAGPQARPASTGAAE